MENKKKLKKDLTNQTIGAIIKLQRTKKAERRKQKKEVFIMTKMTYAQAIDNAINGNITDEVKEKLEALKAQLAKRNSSNRKPSKAQVANEALKGEIVATLTERKTATEVAEAFGISNQKASALLTALVKADAIERTVEKGKAYFQAVA